jgi:hypothetical protein
VGAVPSVSVAVPTAGSGPLRAEHRGAAPSVRARRRPAPPGFVYWLGPFAVVVVLETVARLGLVPA